jgi:hypothetical protein
MLAAQAARAKAIELALTGRDAPFAGAAAEDVIVVEGRLALAKTNLNITYAELLASNGLSGLVGDGHQGMLARERHRCDREGRRQEATSTQPGDCVFRGATALPHQHGGLCHRALLGT